MGQLSPYFILRDGESPESGFLPSASRRVSPFEDGIGLADVWRIIRSRLRLTIFLVLVAMTATAVAIFLTTPIYTASATLLISPEPPQVLDMTQLMADEAGDLDYDYYKTQFELLKSRPLAARVIRELNLETYSWFDPRVQPTGPIDIVLKYCKAIVARLSGDSEHSRVVGLEYSVSPISINRYITHLKIVPTVGTRLVVVKFSLPDSDLAASIVNRHVADFVRIGLELRGESQHTAREFLESELGDIGHRVQSAEAALNAYRQKNGVLAFEVDDTNKIAAQRMEELNKAYTEAETRRITAEAQMDLVKRGQYDSLPQVVNNPSITALRPQLVALEAEYARLSTAFNAPYPKLAELKAQLRETKAEIRNQVGNIADAISREYTAALTQEKKLDDEIQEEKQRDLSLNDALLQDAVLAREVETNRDLYKNVLQRIQQMGVTERTPLSNINVVENAAPPLSPSSPRKLLDLAISGVLALVFGLSLSFVLEHLDNRLKSSDDVEDYLHLPTLAIAPDFRRVDLSKGLARLIFDPRARTEQRKRDSNKLSTTVSEGYRTGKGEIYRTIRTGILFSRAGSAPKTILVTSSIEGEGKTMTAVNTAAAFAQTGASTLLIDADLRRPNCHEMLDSDNGIGLTEVLAGQCEAADLIQRKDQGSLYFLGAGSIPPNPAELLTSSRMRQVMDSLSESYDYVLIDSAPLMYASDTIGIATMVDGVVVVLGAGTAKQSVRKACDRLSRARAKILGVVLNGVDIRHPDYREHSHYYYSYESYNRGDDLLD
jgi:polysaccharide biosynthesis transport protein